MIGEAGSKQNFPKAVGMLTYVLEYRYRQNYFGFSRLQREAKAAWLC